MIEKLKEIKPYVGLFRNSETGIAFVHDGESGIYHSPHPKRAHGWCRPLGYEGRAVSSEGFDYYIDIFSVGTEYDNIAADHCQCHACVERRGEELFDVHMFVTVRVKVKNISAKSQVEAIKKAEEVMGFINEKALQASEELAIQRGVFPFYKDSIYDEKGMHNKDWAKGRPRNAARTTIAPTGTIAIASGLQGSGIEPFFSIVYTRYNGKAIDALKAGEKPNKEDTFYEINTVFRKVAEENNFFELKPEELWEKIEENHNSVRGIQEIPEEIQKIFASAHDVSVEYHLKMQAAFQKNTDNAVSKTINLPNKSTVEDIENAYWLAYDIGCKGITVYRDGCKNLQVLNKKEKATEQEPQKKIKKPDYSQGLASVYYRFETGHGPVHVHVDHQEGQIFKVFTHTTPVGTEIAGLTSVLGIFISKYIEKGGDINEIRGQLNSIKSDKPYGFGSKRVESIPHAISMALSKFLSQTGTMPGQQLLTPHVEEKPAGVKEKETKKGTDHCPKCHSPNVFFASGCSGPTCMDCGYSECS